MLDIQFIREHADQVREAARQKRVDVDIDRLLKLDAMRRGMQQEIDAYAARRNDIARALAQKAPNAQALKDEARALKNRLAGAEKNFRTVWSEYEELLLRVPNLPTDDTPIGPDESGNRILRTWGEHPIFDFPPKEHWELGSALGVIDTERAARVSGSRFCYLLGDLVHLEWGLVHLALHVLTSRPDLERIIAQAGLSVPPTPCIPVIPPVLIRTEVLQRMARLEPKTDRYGISSDDLYLIGSAEHTLGPLHLEETLPEETLPRRYVGLSPAFRREAGSYGKDVHGILRVHQFDKIELESFTVPEQGRAEQDFFVAIQEHLMHSLGLPYQVVLICTGDMGAPDARQVDIEAWFPGQQRYRETHSADYVSDYQARRLRTRVRRPTGETVLVHMNDATVFAIGRTLAALLEVYQAKNGSVRVPEVLRPFLGGRDFIAPLSQGHS